MEHLTEKTPSNVYVPTTQETSSEEFSVDKEAMHDQLDAARRDWASMSAKRQRRLFDRRIHGYNATQENYDKLVIECQKLDLQEALANEPDEMQRRLITVEYWLNEQNLLREETKKTVEGKQTWKFAHAFSELLNSGSPRMRMIKGVALGFGIGVAGSMLGGVLGAATIGTGIVAAGRFARGYFARHKGGIEQHNADAEDLIQQIGGDNLDDVAFEDALRKESSEMFNRDGKKEQSKQRIAFAWGAGSVAVGGAIGWAFAGGSWGLTSAHADTLSHTDVSGLDNSHYDVSDVNGTHTEISTVENTEHYNLSSTDASNHVEVSAVESNHYDISAVEGGHADVSAVENSHYDVSAVEGDSGNEIVDSDTFTVERGSGLIREIRQYAHELGYKDITAQDSFKIYKIILEEHGKNGIIDVHGIAHDTYLFGHDVRISAPGEAEWRNGVSEDLQRLFQAHDAGHKLTSDVLGSHYDVTNTGGADLPNATAEDISESTHADVSTIDLSTSAANHIQLSTVEDNSLPNATAHDIQSARAGMIDIRHGDAIKEAEQIIRKAANPVNVVSHHEGWYQTFTELNKAGVTIAHENYAALLRVAGPELAEFHYDNEVPVAYFDKVAEEWRMNKSPNGRLLPDAVRLIAKYAARHGYDLAA